MLREAGAGWWPEEPGWPSAALRDADVRAILMSLMREADRRWHLDGWSSYRGARVLDVMYDTIKSVPIPRRVLEGLGSIGLERLARLHGIVRGDDR